MTSYTTFDVYKLPRRRTETTETVYYVIAVRVPLVLPKGDVSLKQEVPRVKVQYCKTQRLWQESGGKYNLQVFFDTKIVQAKSVTGDISRSFDDSKTSDVQFITEGGEVIHCHKIILKIRCNHLRVKFETDWSSKESIEVTYPYRIYRAFLYFLYSGTIDLKPEECIELLELATSYGQPDLRHCCEEAMKKEITVRNAALLYDTAVKYGATELEEYSFRFSKFNLSAVTQTEAFGELDKSVIRRFINKAARKGAFKY